ELLVSGLQSLLQARKLRAALAGLGVDLGTELDGFLTCLDLSFPAQSLRLALGVLQELLPRSKRLVETRGADRTDDHDAEHAAGSAPGSTPASAVSAGSPRCARVARIYASP